MISCIFVDCDPCDQLFLLGHMEKLHRVSICLHFYLDTLARVSVPCFFIDLRSIASGKRRTVEKHGERLLRFFDRTGSMECSVLYLESCFY